jgi:hypothetical protein
MRLAPLNQKQDPLAYAREHGYAILEITRNATEFTDVAPLINECIKIAQDKGCHEFYIKQVHWHFHIMEDTHTWYVTLYGFI